MWKKLLASTCLALVMGAPALAQGTPDALVKQISGEVLDAVKADPALQAGKVEQIIQLVDAKVMPHVNFEVMTRSAVGPQWRQASAEQRAKLQAEFKSLLVRVYSGALTEIKDQTVETTKTLPVPQSTQVVVQSEVRGKGEPIKLDYRLDKYADAWKIIDVNVGGIWLVTSYRSQFAPELSKGGIDGLIGALVERNKTAAAAKS
ncbi:MAG TPA: ABC transporter substrate-binding protein [Rubrivivax sp.]|nr:ABC transporter substrate-binding protein [Burkholderiales bacterium]HNT39422.1 ABC transporter substrate-binding protein [Rubrivivax sp.]